MGTALIRVHPHDSLFEILARIAAAKIAKCAPLIGLPKNLENPAVEFLTSREGKKLCKDIPVTRHTDQELIDIIPDIDRIRYAAPGRVPPEVMRAAAKRGFYISRAPVLMEGRIEMLHYFREQSISDSYHRYGNLGERADIG